MFAGGIADKFGNEYERKWVVCLTLEVIAGKADSIRYEGLPTGFRGFELVLVRSGCAEWHQAKMNAPHGNWTLRMLITKGVIDAFKTHLSSDTSTRCVFISQDPATQIRALCEEADIANDADEFEGAISKQRKEVFDDLAKTWNVSKEMAFEWLQRCEFRTESKQSIEERINFFGNCLLSGDGDIYTVLSNYLLNNLNAQITTECVREWLHTNTSFEFRSATLDPTIREEINRANQRYLGSYTPFGVAGQIILRTEATTVSERLQTADRPFLVLLTGEAGSGKSGVVREIMSNLKTCEIPHLAFRIDHYLSCHTGREIGNNVVGRDESPVSILTNLAGDNIAVLIVDQIDVISEVSGRTGVVKEILFELIREAQCYGNVRCLLVCRDFDLENDPQYRDLEKKQKTDRVQVPHLTWEQEIVPILTHANIEPESLSESQKKLLALPINLAVFLEIGDPTFGFTTSTALMKKLLEKKTHNVQRNHDINWNILDPLRNMSHWMSDNQTLSCPNHILDNFDGAQNWLASEGLITVTRSELAFFHESFFDFIFARTFAHSGQDICDLLTSTEQHLFRRTQVRQILTLMRDTDRPYYLKALKTVLTSPQIRLHIKSAVAQWLSNTNDPTQGELEVFESLDDDGEEFPVLMRKALFSSESWFDFLRDNGRLSKMLETTKQARLHCLLWWLSSIANRHPRSIARLLRDWWKHNSKRTQQLAKWFSLLCQMPTEKELALLLRDVVRSARSDVLLEDGGRRITHLLPNLCTTEPRVSAEILQAFFVHWFEQNPREHLFSHSGSGNIDIQDLRELAEKAPIAFLDGMIPVLVKSIDIASSNNSTHGHIHVLYKTKYETGPNALFSLYRDALQTLAATSPSEASAQLDQLEPTAHKILLHLHLETIAENPTALGYRLVTLLDDQNLFLAGLENAEWESFAKAAQSVIQAECLPAQDVKKVEERVLSHRPEHDQIVTILRNAKKQGAIEPSEVRADTLHYLARSGHVEWCVLKTIGYGQLSLDGGKRLAELERKFCAERIPIPRTVEASLVGPPIPSNATRHMTDRQWLDAIKKYVDDYPPNSFRDTSIGGASQLARELGNCTKSDPKRFARLFLDLPHDVNPAYGRSLLEGLAYAELEDKDAMIAALHTAHTYHDQPFGLQITRVVEHHPVCAQDDSVFEAILWYAEYGETSEQPVFSHMEDGSEFPTIDDLIQMSVRLLIDSGINSARGNAWEVLGNLVPNNPHCVPAIWRLIGRRVGRESSAPIRAMMLGTLVPLFKDDLTRFETSLRCLVHPISNDSNDVIDLSPLTTHMGVYLFPFIEREFPGLALTLMKRMVNSSGRNLQLMGAWWALCAQLRHGSLRSQLPNTQRESFALNRLWVATLYLWRFLCEQLWQKSLTNRFFGIHRESPAHAKLWATILCEYVTETEFRDMAVSELVALFSHETPEVRRAAANVFENIPGDDFSYFIKMAQAFIRSPALPTCAYPFVQALNNATCDVTELVIKTAERLTKQESTTGADFDYELRDLLKREYVNSESNPTFRAKLLNLIDSMIEKGSFSANDLIQMADR